MLIQIPYTPDLTQPPATSMVQEYTNRKRSEGTESFTTTKNEGRYIGTHLTEADPLKTENENVKSFPSSYTSGSDEKIQRMDLISENYVSYNTKSLISKLEREFTLWQELGTDDGLIHISNIKDTVDEYEPYLTQDARNRVLLSTIQLILRNNNWERISSSQIKQLVNELKRFSDGEVNWDDLDKFAKQLYRSKLKVV